MVSRNCAKMQCPICGNRDRLLGRGYYLKCPLCKVAFREQREFADELAKYWEDAFWTREEIEKRKKREPVFRQAFEILRRQKPAGGSVLEVGCGIGTFLAVCREGGWSVTGVDPSPIALEVARKEYGLELINASFSSHMFSDRKFDAVFAAQVLHHLREPVAFLADVDRVLAADGVLLLRTPNLVPQEALLWVQWLLRWREEFFCGPALYVFHPDSLSLILRRLGYDQVCFANSRPFIEPPRWPWGTGRSVAASLKRLGLAALKLTSHCVTQALFELSGERVVLGPSIFVVARRGRSRGSSLEGG